MREGTLMLSFANECTGPGLIVRVLHVCMRVQQSTWVGWG
jgi:hypothetical protein